MFWSPGQGCDWMFEFHLPSPAAAAWKQCSGAVISIIFRELQCYSWQHSGQWRHHTSHFSNTVILERQFRIHEWCCCIFPIFVVICFFILYFVFSLIFHCLISPTPGTVKAGCVLSVVAMAGPGPISRHYALSAAPDTSKMGTFPSAPPLAPAKMWIQLLNTGIGISNEHQLGGGAIYQALKHKSRRKMKIIFSSLSRSSTNNTLNKSISDIRTSHSLLLMSISRDTRHGHAEEQWQIKVSGSFLLIRHY